MTDRTRRILTALAAVFPEVLAVTALFAAARTRLERGGDGQRGDAIQWVVLTAIGAALAITAGTVIYNKVTAKANSIDVTTHP